MTKLIFIVSHLIAYTCFAQKTDVILFTEQGEKFYLSVNGAQINASPASRVEALDISGDFAQLNVRFEKAGAPALSKQMMLTPGKQMTAILKRGKKGKYVFRPVSTSAKPVREEQTVSIPVATHTANSEYVDETPVAYADQGGSGNLVDLQVNERGAVNLSVNLPADGAYTSQEDSYTDHDNNTNPDSYRSNNLTARVEGKKIVLSDGRTLDWKYTKTKSLTGVEIEMKEPLNAQVAVSYDGKLAYETEVPFYYREPDWKKFKEYFKLTVKETNGATWSVKLQHSNNNRILIHNLVGRGASETTSVTGPVTTSHTNDCSGMADGDFQRAVSSIKNKSFADEKMAITQQVLRANCLYVSQVKAVMDLFTYEEDKIAVAKKAYPRTVDQNNYYQLNDALTYSESVEELNQFLEGQ